LRGRCITITIAYCTTQLALRRDKMNKIKICYNA